MPSSNHTLIAGRPCLSACTYHVAFFQTASTQSGPVECNQQRKSEHAALSLLAKRFHFVYKMGTLAGIAMQLFVIPGLSRFSTSTKGYSDVWLPDRGLAYPV